MLPGSVDSGNFLVEKRSLPTGCFLGHLGVVQKALGGSCSWCFFVLFLLLLLLLLLLLVVVVVVVVVVVGELFVGFWHGTSLPNEWVLSEGNLTCV